MNEDRNIFSTTQSETINIVSVIWKLRNDLIKDFLDERNLILYLSEQYKIMQLSAIKVEFIKTELKRQLLVPVDLEWYKPIVDDFNATGSAALTEGNEKLFYKEIDGLLKKYIYE